MRRVTIDGYAAVRKSSIGRTYEVLGVGIDDTPSAARDAAEKMTHGRLDATTFLRQNPDVRVIEAKLTITFDDPKERARFDAQGEQEGV